MIYDVIIVGAGPSGSSAAYHLAAHHFSVLILDQRPFPRYKPCGGGLPLHTLAEIPFDIKPVLEFPAASGAITWGGRPVIVVPFESEYAWLADRTKLDAFLLQKACEAGANCLTGVCVNAIREEKDGVQVTAGEQVFRSRWLIGADGVNSITAQALNLLPARKTGIALEAELAVTAETLEQTGQSVIFDFGALPAGYGWVFAKRDHLSVGVFHAKSGKNGNLQKQLEHFIACQPLLKEHEVMHIQGHRIPLGGGERADLHTRRCLLAGDAANLADPWLGEGVYYAVRSGRLAAETLIAAHRQAAAGQEVSLSGYTARVQSEIRRDFQYAGVLARLVYRLPKMATYLLKNTPAAREILFRKIRGDYTFRETCMRLLLNSPLFLMQALHSKLIHQPAKPKI